MRSGAPINTITWQAYEYTYIPKSTDWYWAVGLISLLLAVSAIVFENLLFAIVIIIGTIALVLHAVKIPRFITFTITPRGILINNEKHPYLSMRSFCISDDDETNIKLIIQSNKLLSPYLVIPLENVDEHEVREYLLDFLPEEEHREPATHKLMEYLGF